MPHSLKAILADEARRMERGESPKVLASVGGKARSKKLSPERRSEIAKQAARARWANPNTRTRWTKAKSEEAA